MTAADRLPAEVDVVVVGSGGAGMTLAIVESSSGAADASAMNESIELESASWRSNFNTGSGMNNSSRITVSYGVPEAKCRSSRREVGKRIPPFTMIPINTASAAGRSPASITHSVY